MRGSVKSAGWALPVPLAQTARTASTSWPAPRYHIDTQPGPWFVPVIVLSSAKATCLIDSVQSEPGESGTRL